MKVAIALRALVIDRLLAGDLLELRHRDLDQLRIGRRLADAHVEHDLVELRHLHRVLVAELLGQLRPHHLVIVLLEPRNV